MGRKNTPFSFSRRVAAHARSYGLEKTPAAGYEEIAKEMGLTVENLRQRVSRFKKQVRAAMEDVVRQTVGTNADLDEEFAYLWHCLS